MISLEYDDAVARLERIVKGREDFIYRPPELDYEGREPTGDEDADDLSESCVYFYQREPSCLIGHLLADLGVTQEQMEERHLNHDTSADSIGEILTCDKRTIYLLRTVQDRQDRRCRWGRALEDGLLAVKHLDEGTEPPF